MEIFFDIRNVKAIILVFVGSGLGGVCRYLVGLAYLKSGLVHFPFGTLTVNFIACALAGFLWGFASGKDIPEMYKWLLLTGFCGGFSTFSAFSLESMRLLEQGATVYFFLNVLLSLTLCFLATWLGFVLSR